MSQGSALVLNHVRKEVHSLEDSRIVLVFLPALAPEKCGQQNAQEGGSGLAPTEYAEMTNWTHVNTMQFMATSCVQYHILPRGARLPVAATKTCFQS